MARQWPGLKPFKLSQRGWIFAAAAFLVSVPVFFEAPLVRQWPWLACALTGGWLWLGKMLLSRPGTRVWGDLLIGFTGSWFAGAVYWGWLRWEPLLHLPVEAVPLPLALWCLWRRKLQVGSWFYLGSLFGTAVTDLYFYLVDLIPHWRQLMQVEPELAVPILQSAIARVHTPWGATWAIALAMLLLGMGIVSLRCTKLHAWGFSGALLSTILVDGLFWLAALAA
ncbi:DUF3120 domain-containing protein [Phormidium sp. CCY1219]|uniref:DUF3120 domain-containing protein n=1 Tax=Phormidium sp. CCY1219 TaxID=2886104 RepID=UPI003FA76A71